MRCEKLLLVHAVATTLACVDGFVAYPALTSLHSTVARRASLSMSLFSRKDASAASSVQQIMQAVVAPAALGVAALTGLGPIGGIAPVSPALATDTAAVGKCVISQCQAPLAKCITSPKCLANLVCINTCNNRPDETACQIKCGDLFENEIAGEFNACAVSQKKCVPQRADDGSYPVPPLESIVKKFDASKFDGRWYIAAGLNPLFDTFDCQVHYFVGEPGKLYGKLNWRIDAPDGEKFDKQAIQTFLQDPKQPGVLYNHDNEYLHYQDDWYILDYDNMDNPELGYVLVYYRGSNDAWDGYGGAVLYTRATKLPDAIRARVAEKAAKANLDFAQFRETDNRCLEESKSERVSLREKYATALLSTAEKTLQSEGTVLRASATNAIVGEEQVAERVVKRFEEQFVELEKLAAKDVVAAEKVLEKDLRAVEGVVEKDLKAVEGELEKDLGELLGTKKAAVPR